MSADDVETKNQHFGKLMRKYNASSFLTKQKQILDGLASNLRESISGHKNRHKGVTTCTTVSVNCRYSKNSTQINVLVLVNTEFSYLSPIEKSLPNSTSHLMGTSSN